MLNPVNSFTEVSLKVVAVRTADNSDFQFEFPASGPQSTPCALITPLQQLMQSHLNPFTKGEVWYHGGLNE